MNKVIAQVGLVVFTVLDGKLAVLVGTREQAPELISGSINQEQDLDGEDAAARILQEALNLPARPTFAGAIADAFRHDLGWSVGLVYAVCTPPSVLIDAMNSGAWALLTEDEIADSPLNDDAQAMVQQAKAWLAHESERGFVYANLLEKEFSIPELHKAYELARGARKNRDSFRRTLRQQNVLEAIREVDIGTPTPLQIYSFKAANPS